MPAQNVGSQVQTKMGAVVIITMRIMPASTDTDLTKLKESINAEIEKFAGKPAGNVVESPVAFGLKALDMTFQMEEAKGSVDPLEDAIRALDGVASAEVTRLDRALG